MSTRKALLSDHLIHSWLLFVLNAMAFASLSLLFSGCSTGPGASNLEAPDTEQYAALVVGVSYKSINDPSIHLSNTVNDARLISQKLSELDQNFRFVETVLDPDKLELQAALNDFADRLDQDTIAVFYYAGHGVQIEGVNYILPEDMDGFIQMKDIVSALRSHSKGVVVIFDACRNNPFINDSASEEQYAARALPVISLDAEGYREINLSSVSIDSVGTGLARLEITGSRIMIVYATDPGDVADDSAYPGASNSPFTTALAENVQKKKSFEEILNNVSLALEERASKIEGARKQTPWRQSSWTKPLYFNGELSPFDSGSRSLVPMP